MTDLSRLPTPLSDGEILLDAHTLADAEAHLAGEDEEMRRRFEAPRPATLEETRAAMRRWMAARAAGGPMFAYALRDLAGTLMGGGEISPLAADRANLSYWVFPAFRGRGHATRALALLRRAAEALPRLRQLEAHVEPDNLPSRAVAEKAGFVVAGRAAEEGAGGAKIERIVYARRVGSEPWS